MNPHTEGDAVEFGLHVKQGKWRLGLLVARNVEPGSGQNERGSRHRNHDNEKVSAQAFADKAHTSADRVLRYLRAWGRAAEAGHVPPSSELSPGEEVDLDVSKLPQWGLFYTELKQPILQPASSAPGLPPKEGGPSKYLIQPGRQLLCDEPTQDVIRSIVSELRYILDERIFELNDTDLNRLEVALRSALERIESYATEQGRTRPTGVG